MNYQLRLGFSCKLKHLYTYNKINLSTVASAILTRVSRVCQTAGYPIVRTIADNLQASCLFVVLVLVLLVGFCCWPFWRYSFLCCAFIFMPCGTVLFLHTCVCVCVCVSFS